LVLWFLAHALFFFSLPSSLVRRTSALVSESLAATPVSHPRLISGHSHYPSYPSNFNKSPFYTPPPWTPPHLITTSIRAQTPFANLPHSSPFYIFKIFPVALHPPPSSLPKIPIKDFSLLSYMPSLFLSSVNQLSVDQALVIPPPLL